MTDLTSQSRTRSIEMDMSHPIGIAAVVFLLTADGINADANLVTSASCTNDCTPFTPGAVAFWPMNEETMGADLSGNGNDANLTGLTYTKSPSGISNGALYFHGNDQSYAWVKMSPSMEVGKYLGFSVCGFVRFRSAMPNTPLIDFRNIQKGWGIYAYPQQNILLGVDLSRRDKWAPFTNMTFSTGSWRFFGASYDKATGRVTGFMDGKREEMQMAKNLVAETATTRKVGIGMSYLPGRRSFHGELSCVMLFKVALTADDFERVWRFCSTLNTTQITPPRIRITDITLTAATASWSKPPGTFSGYSVTFERKEGTLDVEIAYPRSLPSSLVRPKVFLVNLVPNATYRINVWHLQGFIKGRVTTSPWFKTKHRQRLPESPIAVTGLTLAVICIFVMITFITGILIRLLRRSNSLSSTSDVSGDVRQLPSSNPECQAGEPSESNTPSNGANYDPYEVPDRTLGDNTTDTIYENVNISEHSNYEQLNVSNT